MASYFDEHELTDRRNNPDFYLELARYSKFIILLVLSSGSITFTMVCLVVILKSHKFEKRRTSYRSLNYVDLCFNSQVASVSQWYAWNCQVFYILLTSKDSDNQQTGSPLLTCKSCIKIHCVHMMQCFRTDIWEHFLHAVNTFYPIQYY